MPPPAVSSLWSAPRAKTPAAASDANVRLPTLKRTLWIGGRRALHSTATVVTASASAALGPKSAAPASMPTAETESVPWSITSSASACPTPTSAMTARRPIQSVLVPSAAPTMPATTPPTETVPTRSESLVESERNRGPLSACGRGWRRSAAGRASGAAGSGSRWSPSSGTATSRDWRSAGMRSGSALAPRTRLRPWSLAR